jgi:hypothetical protein
MTKTDRANRRLAEALISGMRKPLDLLCERLGIEINQPDWVKFAYVGIALARGQPEFTGERPRRTRGRPKKRAGDSVDLRRAEWIEKIQAHVNREFGQQVSDKKVITFGKGKTPLFPKYVKDESLQDSVSRGRAKLKPRRN